MYGWLPNVFGGAPPAFWWGSSAGWSGIPRSLVRDPPVCWGYPWWEYTPICGYPYVARNVYVATTHGCLSVTHICVAATHVCVVAKYVWWCSPTSLVGQRHMFGGDTQQFDGGYTPVGWEIPMVGNTYEYVGIPMLLCMSVYRSHMDGCLLYMYAWLSHVYVWLTHMFDGTAHKSGGAAPPVWWGRQW